MEMGLKKILSAASAMKNSMLIFFTSIYFYFMSVFLKIICFSFKMQPFLIDHVASSAGISPRNKGNDSLMDLRALGCVHFRITWQNFNCDWTLNKCWALWQTKTFKKKHAKGTYQLTNYLQFPPSFGLSLWTSEMSKGQHASAKSCHTAWIHRNVFLLCCH